MKNWFLKTRAQDNFTNNASFLWVAISFGTGDDRSIDWSGLSNVRSQILV